MSDAEHLADFVHANFDLLTDDDMMNSLQLSQEISAEAMEQVQQVLDEIDVLQSKENDEDAEAFEPQPLDLRHVHCSNEKLDEYADESHARATHNQTKWAVTVFRGNCHTFSEKMLFFKK